MTERELNRDFKRLYKSFTKKRGQNTSGWKAQDWSDNQANEDRMKKELARLYYASHGFQYANRNSILYFIEMNRVLKAIAWHHLVTYIEK